MSQNQRFRCKLCGMDVNKIQLHIALCGLYPSYSIHYTKQQMTSAAQSMQVVNQKIREASLKMEKLMLQDSAALEHKVEETKKRAVEFLNWSKYDG